MGKRRVVPIVDNYRRSKKGSALIRQEVEKLLILQCKIFPNKAMLNVDGDRVAWVYNGSKGEISKEEFLLKRPVFFGCVYLDERRKVHWGPKVRSWITGIGKALTVDYKMKPLHELVCLVCESKLRRQRVLRRRMPRRIPQKILRMIPTPPTMKQKRMLRNLFSAYFRDFAGVHEIVHNQSSPSDLNEHKTSVGKKIAQYKLCLLMFADHADGQPCSA